MAKYKPITISEQYVNTVLYDETGKQVSEEVFKGIQQVALLLEKGISVSQNQFEIELAKVANSKSISKAEKSVKETLIAFSEAKKGQGVDVTAVDIVDMFLIPLAFEQWQKDKVVLNLDEEVIDYIKNNPTCPASPKALMSIPNVFWINPISDEDKEKYDGTLVMILSCDKEVADSSDKDNNSKIETEMFVFGWTFFSGSGNNYISHLTSFSLIEDESKMKCISLNPCKGMDTTFIFSLASFLGTGIFVDEMTEISKRTYREPKPGEKPKNRFNEVREYDIHFLEEAKKLLTSTEDENIILEDTKS